MSDNYNWQVGKHPSYHFWCVFRLDQDGGSSSLGSHKTQAEAQAQYDAMAALGHCGECGDVLHDEYCEPYKTQIRQRQRCMRCLYWLNYVATASDRAHVVVAGKHFVINPDAPRAAFQGHGGARFDIRFTDGREVVTHNLWAQGTIPAHFRNRLPDTAEFVTRGHRAVNTLSRTGGYVGAGSADSAVGR